MTNTPAAPPPVSAALRPQDVDATERELIALLQKALEPAFVLIRRLGAGGMGIVYLARDPALKRHVAVKVMSPERAHDPDARARFQREAESVASISHPNVVAVYSVGALANGIPYLVMQYVDGPTMAERLLAEGPLDLPTAKQILGQVASALEAAHRKGIIHRDIKPANILLDESSGRALVSDFGIAAILERDHDGDAMQLTQTGVVLGTPRYMSPEQLLSEPVSERSDIYSLGLLGYEMLTCEGPYQVTSPNQLVAAHLRDAPRPLSTMRPDVDPVLEALLATCLEKDAHARPTAEDLARRLQHGASVLLEWPPPGLEDLHGALDRPLTRFVAGALAISVPLTLIATLPAESGFRPSWPTIAFAPLIATMGAFAVFSAAGDGYRLFRIAVRAARAGYGWGIIAEVLADRDRDTGALITGDREYAVLTVAQRSMIRRWRVMGAAVTGLAGLWSLAGFVLALPIAARVGGGGGLLAAWCLGIPVTFLVAAGVLARRERRLLDPIRARLRKHRSPMERMSHLAQTWRDAFERVMTGVGRGQGAFGRVARRVAAVAAAGLIGATGLITAGGLMVVSVGNEVAQVVSFGSAPTVRDKLGRVERLRALRPAIDPSITPEQAGYALQSIANAGDPDHGGVETPTRFPIGAVDLPKAAQVFLMDGKAIRRARAGLTRDERTLLEQVAAVPGHAQLSLIARAQMADLYGVMLKDPVPDGAVWGVVPIPRYSRVKVVGYANIARAAIAVADGKVAEAERLLRENIGMGFAMIEGPTLIENLIGIVVIGSARTELVALYELTGRAAEARAISADADPVRDPDAEATPTRLTAQERHAQSWAILRDRTAPRGSRWDAAIGLSYEPCGDLSQVLFGASAAHREQMAEARRQLVRTPGEDRLFRITERALESPSRPGATGQPISLGYRGLLRFAQAVDGLTGSKRMESCLTLMNY